jgi:glycosyltransferase involved in cell wall biosynthesis
MKFLFLTSAHVSNDDRIYFLQARTLAKNHEVRVYSTFGGEEIQENQLIAYYDNTSFRSRKDKIKAFYDQCVKFSPDVIICSEPIPILGANRYKKEKKSCRLLYDITEFYPSKKNFIGFSPLKKLIAAIGMVWLNRKASALVDGFIFGEHFKSLYYKANFKNQPYILLPYYQDLNYFPQFKIPSSKLIFGYTGKFSEEKGIIRFANFIKFFNEKNPEVTFSIKLIGWFESELVRKEFFRLADEISIDFVENLPFEEYCHSLSEISVFFDLRDVDAENNLCLPIKLFTYAAVGRPVIYSPIQAILQAHPEHDFIKLCNNENYDFITKIVQEIISDQNRFHEMCLESRKFAEKHQWEAIKDEFIRFVTTNE